MDIHVLIQTESGNSGRYLSGKFVKAHNQLTYIACLKAQSRESNCVYIVK